MKITGTGNCKGTAKKTFKIYPESTKISSLSSVSKGLKVKWTAVTKQAAGYQIQIAANKSFTKGKKTVTVSGYKKKSIYVTSLKASKTCYVRIRTYKTVSGKKYYSSWSASKTVKGLVGHGI